MDNQQAWSLAEKCLAHHPHFSALTLRQRRKLLSFLTLHRLGEGQTLLKPGESSDYCWLLLSGELRSLEQQHPHPFQTDQPADDQGGYYDAGDFVAIEHFVNGTAATAYLTAPDQEVLLLGFSRIDLKVLFRQSPRLLQRLRPVLDPHHRLLAGLPEPLWRAFSAEQRLSRHSYQPVRLRLHRSWQPVILTIVVFCFLALILPNRWLSFARYPLALTALTLTGVLIKMRYALEVVVSEHSLIVSRSLGWYFHSYAYPLQQIADLKVKNRLLFPFLPSLGTLTFRSAHQECTLNWVATPHRIAHTIQMIQQRLAQQQQPTLHFVDRPQQLPPPRLDELRKSPTSLTLLALALAGFDLYLLQAHLSPPWPLAALLLSVTSFASVWILWIRFRWQIDKQGCWCRDRLDRHGPPWKFLKLEEINSVQVDSNWLEKLCRYGTITLTCKHRQEKIKMVADPHLALEKIELLRQELAHHSAIDEYSSSE